MHISEVIRFVIGVLFGVGCTLTLVNIFIERKLRKIQDDLNATQRVQDAIQAAREADKKRGVKS